MIETEKGSPGPETSFRKLAVPLFLTTAAIYFLVAFNQCTPYGSVDKTFLFFGGLYICLSALYLGSSATQRRRKILSDRHAGN